MTRGPRNAQMPAVSAKIVERRDERVRESPGERPHLQACPICRSARLHYAFGIQGFRAVRCADCGILMLNPQPTDAELSEVYGESYFLGHPSPEGRSSVSEIKVAT